MLPLRAIILSQCDEPEAICDQLTGYSKIPTMQTVWMPFHFVCFCFVFRNVKLVNDSLTSINLPYKGAFDICLNFFSGT